MKTRANIQPSAVLAALSDGSPVSGTDLADRLGVTRAAVWKHIEALREAGAPIEAAAGSGYRLAWKFEALDAAAIRRELGARRAPEISVLWQTDSTNSELLANASKARDFSVVVAERQLSGRGRRGRVWHSPLGGNVYFSLLKHFAGGMGSLAGLSVVAGIALVNALAACGVCDIALKWPNDVIARDRKLAGILVELGGEFLGPCFAVIGIGVNVRLPANAEIDQPFIDLATLTHDKPPSRNVLIARLIEQLESRMKRFESKGFADFEKDFALHDLLARKTVTIQTPHGTRVGVADGVDSRGALRVLHDGAATIYDSAEVSVRA